jgi:hypothetical protein
VWAAIELETFLEKRIAVDRDVATCLDVLGVVLIALAFFVGAVGVPAIWWLETQVLDDKHEFRWAQNTASNCANPAFQEQEPQSQNYGVRRKRVSFKM